MEKKINVLGTEYTIHFFDTEEDKHLQDVDGYIDQTVKKIVVKNKYEDAEIADVEHYKKQVPRHEITHAFMMESGLAYNFEHKPIGIEDTMVDWIAIQSPKIYRAFMEADCL